jgi:hypothetical protein
MGNYKLTEDAKDDLRRIYRYGVKEFGEAQADLYYELQFRKSGTCRSYRTFRASNLKSCGSVGKRFFARHLQVGRIGMVGTKNMCPTGLMLHFQAPRLPIG